MRKSERKVAVPPQLDPEQALDLLRRQVERADAIIGSRYDDPEVDRWENTTTSILNATFGMPNGEPHQNTTDFENAFGGPLRINMTEAELQRNHVTLTTRRKVLLEGFIEQLRDIGRPSRAAGSYSFHPDIERVSGAMLRDGHFKSAALEAYILVINAVKAKSGLSLDGEPLMNRVFGCDKQTPALRFNDLNSAAEIDEQRGLMNLYKGIVGLRNSKAHSNAVFDSPERAYEYLALASLLLRLLEIAKG